MDDFRVDLLVIPEDRVLFLSNLDRSTTELYEFLLAIHILYNIPPQLLKQARFSYFSYLNQEQILT